MPEQLPGGGNLQARYDYDMWGNRKKLWGDLDSDVGYTGHHHHAKSGLVLTWYRAYDPEAGRWLSPDPIGEAGGMNLYGYVGGNPVNFDDELGLQARPPRIIRGPGARVGPLGSRTNPFVFTKGGGPLPPSRYALPRKGTSRCKQINNMLRTMEYAHANQGNQRIYTQGEVFYMAMRWLGPGARVMSKGDAMIPANGSRVWRPPSNKNRLTQLQECNLIFSNEVQTAKIYLTTISMSVTNRGLYLESFFSIKLDLEAPNTIPPEDLFFPVDLRFGFHGVEGTNDYFAFVASLEAV